MTSGDLAAAPILSTPDTHIFEDTTQQPTLQARSRLSDEQLYVRYEIARTVREIRAAAWKRIALQFPDEMLVDAPRVFENLRNALRASRLEDTSRTNLDEIGDDVTDAVEKLRIDAAVAEATPDF